MDISTSVEILTIQFSWPDTCKMQAVRTVPQLPSPESVLTVKGDSEESWNLLLASFNCQVNSMVGCLYQPVCNANYKPVHLLPSPEDVLTVKGASGESWNHLLESLNCQVNSMLGCFYQPVCNENYKQSDQFICSHLLRICWWLKGLVRKGEIFYWKASTVKWTLCLAVGINLFRPWNPSPNYEGPVGWCLKPVLLAKANKKW